MNAQVITLDPVTSPTHTKNILAKEGFQCSLIMLAPGDETPPLEAADVEEQILFVVEGQATVRHGELNTMLNKDEAVHIPKGRAHRISSGADEWAKLLRVDVQPRQVVTPQLLSFEK